MNRFGYVPEAVGRVQVCKQGLKTRRLQSNPTVSETQINDR